MEGKKSRLSSAMAINRICDLPDAILGHILSFLPTDKAVATSILSKRWKSAWVSVHSLHFYYRYNRREIDKEDTFVRFVNRVLLLNDVGSLNKFELFCDPLSVSPQIVSWINTAITRNVTHLHLMVGNIEVPACLFSCHSLQSLNLFGFIPIHATIAVSLPRLVSLKTFRVSFKSEEAFEKLIGGCPILDSLELFIEGNDGESNCGFTYLISSASLRRLVMYSSFRNGYKCKLKLKASSLEYLSLNGYISEIFVEKGLSSLVTANFNIDLHKDDFLKDSIVEAVSAFEHAKYLTLSADVMQALSRATISLSTEFKRLVKLEACSAVQIFIESSSNLEAHISFTDSWLVISDPQYRPSWTAFAVVLRRVSNSLKKVRFCGYRGLEDEREMIRYMLEHGNALEHLQIHCHKMDDGEKVKSIQEIREFPKKSPVCKVCIPMKLPSKRRFKP